MGRLWKPDIDSDFWETTFAFLDDPESVTPKSRTKAVPVPMFINDRLPPPTPQSKKRNSYF